MESMKLRGTVALLAALTLTACAGAETDPLDALTPEIRQALNDESLDCLDGDNAACNRLRALARAEVPGTNYEDIGATCGGRIDEPLQYGTYCDVP